MGRTGLTLVLLLLFTTLVATTEDSHTGPPSSVRKVNAQTECAGGAQPVLHQARGERLALQLRAHGLPPEAVVVAISMLPVVELRGAIPVGNNLFRLRWFTTAVLAVIGNMLPVFLILLLLQSAVRLLSRSRAFRRFFDWLFARTRRRSNLIQRWEFWGLVVFVSIPLPVTGAWTGSVAAVLMGLPYWRSVLAILLGVMTAGAVVTMLSLLGWWGALLAGTGLLVLILRSLLPSRRCRT